MSDKRLISVDEHGKQTWLHVEDGKHYVQRVEDVRPIIEACKTLKNEATGRMGEMQLVGLIPGTVLHRWMREDGINYLAHENKGLLMKKLEERDNSIFKTHPGKFA